MSKNGANRAKFIQLYRRKLQNDLDDMGYPSGKDLDAGNRSELEALIMNFRSQLSDQAVDSASRINRAVAQE